MLQALYRLLAVSLLARAGDVTSKAFLSWGNILNVLRQASLLFLIASGLTLVILTAGLDLSVGANLGLSAWLAAAVIKHRSTVARRGHRTRSAEPSSGSATG